MRPNHPRLYDQIPASIQAVLFPYLDHGAVRWPLLFHGAQPGTGKTSAALWMLDFFECARDDYHFSADVAEILSGFVDFQDLPRILNNADKGRYGYSTSHGTGGNLYAQQLWVGMERVKMLVVDDVRIPPKGERVLGEDFYSALKRILDRRVGKPLILTTNLTPAEIARDFDDRVVSRILAGTTVEVAGADRRLI